METSLPAGSASTSDTKPITTEELHTLCDRDIANIISYVQSTPIPDGKHGQFALLPTFAQATWHFGAEEYIASKKFTSPARMPSIKGAISTTGQTWGYWTHDYSEDKLVLLRLVSLFPSTPDVEEEAVVELAGILYAAQAEAASWEFHKVVIWNPQARTLAACKLVLGGREPHVRERTEGSIPCVRWIGSMGNGEFEEGLEWIASEKYDWC